MDKRLLISENKLSVGQKLYSFRHGEVVLKEILKNDSYPIVCENKNNDKCTFTEKGKQYLTDDTPILFMKNPFKYTGERIVLVSFNGGLAKRVLIKELPNGDAVCWIGAESIEASKNEIGTNRWKAKDWKEIEDEEELVHLTFEQISKGEGKGVPAHLLRIKE